jgi:hypothetical protein
VTNIINLDIYVPMPHCIIQWRSFESIPAKVLQLTDKSSGISEPGSKKSPAPHIGLVFKKK